MYYKSFVSLPNREETSVKCANIDKLKNFPLHLIVVHQFTEVLKVVQLSILNSR